MSWTILKILLSSKSTLLEDVSTIPLIVTCKKAWELGRHPDVMWDQSSWLKLKLPTKQSDKYQNLPPLSTIYSKHHLRSTIAFPPFIQNTRILWRRKWKFKKKGRMKKEAKKIRYQKCLTHARIVWPLTK